ncbi:TolC family protein [Neoehrlichia mikurensis]|uniref:TolC family protein n=1 Tax=Neoehrlichia mikurensis TaxID=89586 RepID=A0A9Q9BTA8_9RICK|nr:TolC family protein [Neoehrlichia mikurensis]QXK91658.1 TolC family protein [Neoehrlichia mikurensis]QXK92869.1 TolC family protein [Neoehrlichia mikurensis]QXK93349.1 TolC family protein [Neoehrlichia mikurensis]UTO55707.1 TolC family protein [Neoehrlichia mikurensis]UTO56624.1 TolC family protein [Neoehrlichia mikurensis]
MYKSAFLLLILTILPLYAYSTSLNDALIKTLENNPSLKNSFYETLGNKKQVFFSSISELLPNVTYFIRSASNGINSINIPNQNKTTGIMLSESLSMATISALQQSRYLLGIQDLSFLLRKQNILLNAIRAYMNVLTAIEVYKLNQNNEKILKQHLLIAQKRFNVGEITKTDVSKTKALLSAAISDTIKAHGNMKVAEASYFHIIGEQPTNLHYPEMPIKIPVALEDALNLARQNSIALKLASYAYISAKKDILTTLAKSLPYLSITANLTSPFNTSNYMSNIDFQISLPIFQKGVNIANIEQSHIARKQKMYAYYEALKSLEESVVLNWENLSTAQSMLQSAKDSIKYATVVLESVKEEAKLNLKTILDVSDAEQELLKAKVNLINAQSSVIINQYNLLALIGQFNLN